MTESQHPWDGDLDEVFRAKYGLVPDEVLPEMMLPSFKNIRELMADAWQFGYTTGMKDSVTFGERLAALDEALDDLRSQWPEERQPDAPKPKPIRGQHPQF